MDLIGQFDELRPWIIPNTNVPINYISVPSLVDGKVCAILSDLEKFVGRQRFLDILSYIYVTIIHYLIFATTYLGYSSCYVCGATAKQMSKPRGVLHDFIPKPGTLIFGLHPLHEEMSALRWFCKTAFHQDFREPEARGEYCIYIPRKINRYWQII